MPLELFHIGWLHFAQDDQTWPTNKNHQNKYQDDKIKAWDQVKYSKIVNKTYV